MDTEDTPRLTQAVAASQAADYAAALRGEEPNEEKDPPPCLSKLAQKTLSGSSERDHKIFEIFDQVFAQ